MMTFLTLSHPFLSVSTAKLLTFLDKNYIQGNGAVSFGKKPSIVAPAAPCHVRFN
jgi:hypothetical protein